MKKSPLVSIGIPTYNRSKDLLPVIQSFLRQSYKNIEVIISDNHSTDDTARVCRALAKKDARIRYVRQVKGIPAIANFNATLKKAKGEYFMWGADDDMWDKEYVKLCVATFSHEPTSTVLVTPKFCVTDQKKHIRKDQRCSFSNYTKKYLDLASYLREDFGGFKADVFFGFYRTAFLKEIGGYKQLSALAASDILTMHEVLCKGKVRLLNKVLFLKQEYYPDADDKQKVRKHKFLSAFSFLFSWWYTLQNYIVPQNLFFLLKHVRVYYNYTDKLINEYKQGSLYLKVLNLYSSYLLFLTLVPNNIQRLRTRDKVFTGQV